MNLLSRVLRAWVNLVLRRPRLILGIAILLALASAALTATKLEMLTDQLELISENHPLIALSDRIDPFNADSKRRFDVVVEAPDPYVAVSFIKELSLRIAKDPEYFQDIYYRVDPEPFKSWQLLYLDTDVLVELNKTLDSHRGLVQGFSQKPELLSFLKLLNQEMASRMVGELFTGFLNDGEPAGGKEEPFDLRFLIATLEGMSSYVHGSPNFKTPWASLLKDASWDSELEGYFWEGGKKYLVAFVVPRKTGDSVIVTQEPLERLRKMIKEVQVSHSGVKAGVTGQEALNNDEMSTVMDDMAVATWLSLLGVFILMVAFRRSLKRPVIQIFSLTVGLCWSFGWATLFVGHLNVLSVVFAPLLCGLGVDSGIHWFSRLEEEERDSSGDMNAVIRRVTDRSGPGIILAGFGTTLSFLPFVLTGFRGLMELGLITGMGIFLNLLADFTVLPALTVIADSRSLKKASVAEAPEPRDLIRLDARSARMVLSGAGILAVLCILSGSRVWFDLNPLRLQTANAESVVWEKRLIEHSDRSALFVSALAASPDDVRTKTYALKALPSVSSVESVLSLLPECQEEKIPLLRSLQPKIPEIRPTVAVNDPKDLGEFVDILERIRFKLQDDQAARWGAGKPLVEQMVRVRALVQDITEVLRSSPDASGRLFEYRKRFLQDLTGKWDSLREGAGASPMKVENLPERIRGWFYRDGTYLLRIFPRESVWEENALTRFVQELQSVDPEVVGDPVSLYVFASAFKTACIKASVYAVIAILIMLAFTFRNVRLTLLGIAPLALGGLWTVGIMGLADIQFNLANSVFMPLVVGAGVEYAIIILSRWKEGRMIPGHIPMSTGKGVILAALTTTLGFGALMISHHRGIFSLGLVAWAGSICVLLCALILLPAILAGMTPPKVEAKG